MVISMLWRKHSVLREVIGGEDVSRYLNKELNQLVLENVRIMSILSRGSMSK